MAVKVEVSFQDLMEFSEIGPPRISKATLLCQACCEHVRTHSVVAADGLPAVEAFCGARRHPSVMIRDGKIIGTSA